LQWSEVMIAIRDPLWRRSSSRASSTLRALRRIDPSSAAITVSALSNGIVSP